MLNDQTATQPKPGRLVKIKTAAETIGEVGVSTLYRLAKSGRIPSYTIGATGVRVDIDEVREALRRHAVAPSAA